MPLHLLRLLARDPEALVLPHGDDDLPELSLLVNHITSPMLHLRGRRSQPYSSVPRRSLRHRPGCPSLRVAFEKLVEVPVSDRDEWRITAERFPSDFFSLIHPDFKDFSKNFL